MTETQTAVSTTVSMGEMFIAALQRLDNAGRSRLKRNAGRNLAEARDVQRVFYSLLPVAVPEPLHDTYFQVATLFPLAEHDDGGGSFAATLRSVRYQRESASIDRRFQALLDSDREQLPFRLRQAVRLAAATGEAVNWTLLLRDLLNWNRDGRPVQLRWARDYFIGRAAQDQ